MRMQEARERLDALEAQETAAASPTASNRTIAIILWVGVVLVAVAIYFLAAWYHRL